jgi:hypothetical protein
LHARGCKTDEQNNSEGFPRHYAQLTRTVIPSLCPKMT